MESPTLISLFAGAGGLDLGLEQAGFRTLVANEVDKSACETLRQNQILSRLTPKQFGPWFERQLSQRCYFGQRAEMIGELRTRLRADSLGRKYLSDAVIAELDVRAFTGEAALEMTGRRRGEIDLIAGGPPCQPFSRAGKRESVATDTGKLFKQFVRMVDEVRPRWFLFENVKGLILTKTPLAKYKCRNCREYGLLRFDEWETLQEKPEAKISCYECSSDCTEIAWETKPGGSLDIILQEFSALGYRCHHRILNAADFGAPQIRERLFIVGSRDGEPFDWPSQTHRKSDEIGQVTLFDNYNAQCWENMSDKLWPEGHWRYGKLGREAVLWVKNVVRPHDEPVTWSLNRPSPTIGAHQGAKLAIAPSGVPEEQIFRQQWHSIGRRQGDTPPVTVEHEYLTDLELLRLQTFPDSWYLHGTRMERAFQIGNAVPPVLARSVGNALLAAMHLPLTVRDSGVAYA
jgi:DNA (cytosine-5)-methyltransferase 1